MCNSLACGVERMTRRPQGTALRADPLADMKQVPPLIPNHWLLCDCKKNVPSLSFPKVLPIKIDPVTLRDYTIHTLEDLRRVDTFASIKVISIRYYFPFSTRAYWLSRVSCCYCCYFCLHPFESFGDALSCELTMATTTNYRRPLFH